MDGEPLLDGVADDVPGRPPDSAVVVDSVQELLLGEIHGFVEPTSRVLLLVIPVGREVRHSGAQVGADGISS